MAQKPKSNQPDFLKIVLIGMVASGKTCLLNRFTEETYSIDPGTLGVDYKKKIVLCDGHKLKLQIWEIAGQERYRPLILNFL